MNTHEIREILAELEDSFMVQNGPRPIIHLIDERGVVGEGQILDHKVKFDIKFKDNQ